MKLCGRRRAGSMAGRAERRGLSRHKGSDSTTLAVQLERRSWPIWSQLHIRNAVKWKTGAIWLSISIFNNKE